jgi:alkyl hydroperoxide reductase subunit AhpC
VLLQKDGTSLRGTFIIDPKQNVRVASINDMPIGRSVGEVLRLVEAIRYNDEFGEGFPISKQNFMIFSVSCKLEER